MTIEEVVADANAYKEGLNNEFRTAVSGLNEIRSNLNTAIVNSENQNLVVPQILEVKDESKVYAILFALGLLGAWYYFGKGFKL